MTSYEFATAQRPSTTPGLIGAMVLGFGLPWGLGMALNSLRPDLMGPMLQHLFGLLLMLVEVVLCLGATATYLTAATVNFKSRTPRVVLTLAGALIFTLPAMLGVLFGPIVFAFLYGPAPSR